MEGIDYHHTMEKIIVYTDGGCSGNPGPGGWAYVVVLDPSQDVITGSGHATPTTNNRMELTAVIMVLKYLSALPEVAGVPVQLHTDSQYVKNGITSWIYSWIRNGWRTSAKKPVKNKDLWMELKALADALPIEWCWVPGHAGVELNELCDALVQQEIRKQ